MRLSRAESVMSTGEDVPTTRRTTLFSQRSFLHRVALHLPGSDLETGAATHKMQVAPVKLSRWAEFQDTVLEADYRRDEVPAHEFGRVTGTIAVVNVVFTFIGLFSLISAQTNGRGLASYWQLMIMLAIYEFVWLAYAAYAYGAVIRGWKRCTECLFVVLFVMTQVPGEILLIRSRAFGSGTEQIANRHTLFLIVAYAVYAPIRVRHCVTVALAGAVTFVVNVLLSRLANGSAFLNYASLCDNLPSSIGGCIQLICMTYLIVLANVRLNTVHRSAYHFYRAVEVATAARHVTTTRRQERHRRDSDNAMERQRRDSEMQLTSQRNASAMELTTRTDAAAKGGRARLIRSVMHSLRSPLLSVANSTVVLFDLEPATRVDDPVVADCLRAMAASSELMQHIVADMLDFEHVSSGRLELVRSHVRVSQLLHAAAETFVGLAAAKGITFLIEALPPDLEHAVFIGDGRRLQQCVQNGVINSIKFTESGGLITIRAWRQESTQDEEGSDDDDEKAALPAPTVRLFDSPTSQVVVEVQDTGSGLSIDELLAVNEGEAFAQVGRGQLQGGGGTGLGLTLVREILRLHNSVMRLSSPGAGRGAILRLTLNLKKADEEDSEAITPSSWQGSFMGRRTSGSPHALAEETPAFGRRSAAAVVSPRSLALPQGGSGSPTSKSTFPVGFRVLHVEDDVMLRKTFELRVLRKLGVPFDVAENGAEAVRLILEQRMHYDFVLMDNQMPILTGEKATRALRNGGFTGMIVGMTGDPTGSPDRSAFEEAGLDLCVDKDTPGVRRVAELIGGFAVADGERASSPMPVSPNSTGKSFSPRAGILRLFSATPDMGSPSLLLAPLSRSTPVRVAPSPLSRLTGSSPNRNSSSMLSRISGSSPGRVSPSPPSPIRPPRLPSPELGLPFTLVTPATVGESQSNSCRGNGWRPESVPEPIFIG